MALKPELSALILADRIYIDQRTSKCVIAGTFNGIWAPKFPATHQQMTCVYICVTNLRGSCEFELRFVHLASNRVLMVIPKLAATSDNPMLAQELIVEIPMIPLPDKGDYAFELYCRNELIGHKRVYVNERKPQ